jgi:hypothetical protein
MPPKAMETLRKTPRNAAQSTRIFCIIAASLFKIWINLGTTILPHSIVCLMQKDKGIFENLQKGFSGKVTTNGHGKTLW